MIISRRRTAALTAAIVGAAVIAGGGVTFALNDDREASVTGPEADRAVVAALAHVGGGSVQGVEREGGASWEVEVVTKAGRPVEVLLDRRFRVVAVEGDVKGHDGPDDD